MEIPETVFKESIINSLSHRDYYDKGATILVELYFVSELIKSAKLSLVLIDNYIDETVFTLFTKRKKGVTVIFYTKTITKQLLLDTQKHNAKYDAIEIKEFNQSHDRFLIIDDKDIYHFGASLKDLGKKWFAFSKFDKGAVEMLVKLGNM